MKSMLIVVFFTLLIVFYKNANYIDKNYDESLQANKSSLFLNYVSAFDNYYLANANVNGDVTNNVKLPIWIPTDSSIKMYVNGGYGYVFMPSGSGILSKILTATDYSELVGLSDSSVIKMNSGTIAKPEFIPAGYIVYVR